MCQIHSSFSLYLFSITNSVLKKVTKEKKMSFFLLSLLLLPHPHPPCTTISLNLISKAKEKKTTAIAMRSIKLFFFFLFSSTYLKKVRKRKENLEYNRCLRDDLISALSVSFDCGKLFEEISDAGRILWDIMDLYVNSRR